MSWFPFFTELSGQPALVVGGGVVALRKVEKLLPFGAELKVVSPRFTEELLHMEGVERIEREFLPSDVEGMLFVIGATDSEETNSLIHRLCRERNIPVNIVDDKEKCTFLFPALVKRGEFVAAFTTGGNSPLAAKYLREKTEESLPERFDEIIAFMGEVRAEIRESVSDGKERERILKKVFALAMERGERPKEEEWKALLKGGKDHAG